MAIQSEFDGILRQLISRTVGPENADDVIQDTYHRAHRYRHTLREEYKLGPWLMRIARNQCNELLQRNYNDELVGLPGDEMLEILADYSAHGSFSTVLDQVTLRMDLQRALAQLPETHREVIALHYLHEMPVSDIAKLLALPVSTVKWRIHRGLELCRLQMLEYQFGHDKKEDKTK